MIITPERISQIAADPDQFTGAQIREALQYAVGYIHTVENSAPTAYCGRSSLTALAELHQSGE